MSEPSQTDEAARSDAATRSGDDRADVERLGDDEAGAGPDGWLDALRRDPTRRRIALVVGALAGIALASVHWLGIVGGGALVGLTRRTLRRALGAGLLFGVLVVLAALVFTPGFSPETISVLGPVAYVSIALTLLLAVWGSLARAVA